jgi:hypothetical protein
LHLLHGRLNPITPSNNCSRPLPRTIVPWRQSFSPAIILKEIFAALRLFAPCSKRVGSHDLYLEQQFLVNEFRMRITQENFHGSTLCGCLELAPHQPNRSLCFGWAINLGPPKLDLKGDITIFGEKPPQNHAASIHQNGNGLPGTPPDVCLSDRTPEQNDILDADRVRRARHYGLRQFGETIARFFKEVARAALLAE